ncbi:hypothetical protein CDAR_223631 [Caerostris darwini]|uniref:Maturase K n=1 Tax=Caerostris darwini TaxID=1538125 RepID=A0AAV4RVU6_9ARAC|nr:hypothetical protein CDAR_223631 [Caerostris darwini]
MFLLENLRSDILLVGCNTEIPLFGNRACSFLEYYVLHKQVLTDNGYVSCSRGHLSFTVLHRTAVFASVRRSLHPLYGERPSVVHLLPMV